MVVSNNEIEVLKLRLHEGVAEIIFNRPGALNAVDIDMAAAFRSAIAQVAADPTIRLLILRGEGRAFMAGGDVAQLSSDPERNVDQIISPLHEGLVQMSRLPIPVLAVLHGAVAGAGMSIALSADLALAADNTVFQMAYTKIGANPDASGSWHLPRIVGLRKAMELTLLSDSIDAQTAQQLGLVNWVAPLSELEERVDALSKRITEGAVNAFGRSKALLRQAGNNTLEQQLEAERQAFLAGAQGAEFREGADAFLNKRRPDFKGAAK